MRKTLPPLVTQSRWLSRRRSEALDVEVGQIVKSLVFLRDDEPVLVLCAGDRRVDAKRLGLSVASAERVRDVTGFSIGGIPPLGHDVELPTTIDESLIAAILRARVTAVS